MSKIIQVWKVNNFGKGVLNGSQDFFRITPDPSPNGGGAVDSVNGQTGDVVLDAGDVGAEPTLGFTPENVTNKATNLTTPDNTKYPTTQAVANGLALNVAKADYTPSHSVLAQQSGTGSPTAVQIGTNEILGRLSGGGSNIKGLTTSETRTLLSINNVDNTSDLNKPISTATANRIVPGTSTATEIDFATIKIFGTPSAPLTANLTNSLTGALTGLVQKIYHNNATAPTVPAGWVLIGGSYATSELNIIYAEFVSGSRVEYWITQEQ
jgi:hypothetical protein